MSLLQAVRTTQPLLLIAGCGLARVVVILELPLGLNFLKFIVRTWCDSIDDLLNQQLDVLIISVAEMMFWRSWRKGLKSGNWRLSAALFFAESKVSILSFEAIVRRICSSIAAKDASDSLRPHLSILQ